MTGLLRLRAGLPQVVRADGRSLRIARWPGTERTAQVGPVPGEAPPTPALVRAALDDLDHHGYLHVVTTALFPPECDPFVDVGFTDRDRLVLLRRGLTAAGPRIERSDERIRTARRGEWPLLADLDRRAFPPGWGLDVAAIADAAGATPRSRVRAVGHPAHGYAVTGRSRVRGYLQRLAVDPARSGRGVGTALVADALAWLRARGATEVMVNTSEANTRALALYERLGFEQLPHRLHVLGRSTTAPS